MFLAAASNASAKTLYLEPNVWDQANAWYAIYYFNSSQNGWSNKMTSVGEGVYTTTIPDGNWSVIYCSPSRMPGASHPYTDSARRSHNHSE